MDKHVNSIIAHSYKLLKNIGRIRNILTNKYTETLVHALIWRLDYCISSFVNMSKRHIFKLRKYIWDAVARLVVKRKKYCSITSVLQAGVWRGDGGAMLEYQVCCVFLVPIHLQFTNFDGRMKMDATLMPKCAQIQGDVGRSDEKSQEQRMQQIFL